MRLGDFATQVGASSRLGDWLWSLATMTIRLLAFFFCLFMLLTSREPPWTDAHVVYDTTQALVDRGELNIHLGGLPSYFVVRPDGRKYSVYPLGAVIALVPSYVVYKALRHLPGMPDRAWFALTSHLSSSLLMAAAAALFFQLCRRRGVGPGWSFIGALTLGFGTVCFVYARSPYSEALQTMALVWLVERTLAQAEKPTTAGLCWLAAAAGVLLNSKLVYALVLPLVAAYLVYERRRRGELHSFLRQLPAPLAVFGAFAALILCHNHIKTGSFFDSGYHSAESSFAGDLWTGLYGLTLSTGKGALFYSPPRVLGLRGAPTAWRRRRTETAFLVSLIALIVLFNSKYLYWQGGWCWGPRYLVPVTPLILLLAFPWLPEAVGRGHRYFRRALLGGVLALGLWVQLLGAAFYWDHYIRGLLAVKNQTGASGWFDVSLLHGDFIPMFSPIVGHYWMLKHLVARDPDLDRDAPWKFQIPRPANLSDVWQRMTLDWWPLNFASAPGAGAALGGLFAGGALASGWWLRRGLRSMELEGRRREERTAE
jgi:hypothetical protein